jgi:hypothetical protein
MREGAARTPADDDRDRTSAAIAQRLRALPSELPPPFDWSELRRRTGLDGADSRHRHGASLAARRAILFAAGLASIVAAAALISRLFGIGIESRNHDWPQVTQNARPPATPAELRVAGEGGDSEQLLQRAKAAERWLAMEPDNPQIIQVSTYLAVSALEDRIATVDDQLSTERLTHGPPARVRALQLQRARMVDSLAQVRYAELLAADVP